MIAVRPGIVYIDGKRRMVRKGRTTAHSDHPIVTEHRKLWVRLAVDYPTEVDPAQTPARADQDSPADDLDQDSPALRAAIRRWAAEVGIEVSPRGRIPDAVRDKYRASLGG
jgi:hypothetical protein